MNKYILYIIFLFIISSCSNKLIGKYEYTGNCLGWGFEKFQLKEHNKFEYISCGEMVEPDTIKGYFEKKFKTLILKPILPYEYKLQKGFVISSNNSKYTDSTLIQFYSLPTILTKINNYLYNTNKDSLELQSFNRKDTVKEYTSFRINSKYYYTDSVGLITVKLSKNDTISVCQFLTDCEKLFSYIVKSDSIKKLDIYHPIKGFNPYYYTKVYKIKRGKFYQESDRFITESIVKKTNKYKCIDYKERRNIRDSIFKLIEKNINRKVIIDGCCDFDDFYIVFNKKGTVKKVILNTENNFNSYYNFLFNIYSYKIRKEIKKSINEYKIPYFDKINYNFMVRLVIEYDDNTDTLNLNDFY